MMKVKRGRLCEQEQLATDLDRALSLSQLGSLGTARKLSPSSKLERSKSKTAESRTKERGAHTSNKAAKNKVATKASALEGVQKVKGQKKSSLFCPTRSELSSCSNSKYKQTRIHTLTHTKVSKRSGVGQNEVRCGPVLVQRVSCFCLSY